MEKDEVMAGIGVNSASGSRPKKPAKKGFRRVEIEAADNGHIVHLYPYQSTNGPYMEPARHVFENSEKALKFVAGKLKG